MSNSVAFNTLTMFATTQKKALCLSSRCSPFSHLIHWFLGVTNLHLASTDCCVPYTSYKWKYLCDLLCLACSRFIHVIACIIASLLFMADYHSVRVHYNVYPLIRRTPSYHGPSTDGHSTIMNSTAMNMHTHILVFNSLGYTQDLNRMGCMVIPSSGC